LIALSAFRGKKIALLTHVGADVDAIAAAGALSLFLRKKNRVRIGVPEHISLAAKAFAKRTGISYRINPSLDGFDCIILIDFNSWDMLGEMKNAVENFAGEKFLLDHHTKSRDVIVPRANRWIEEDAASSCTLAYKWLRRSNEAFGRKTATLIACGITADSANFLVANAGTFSIMAEMLEKSNRRFSEIIGLLKVERDPSEKIAVLKAAKRSRIFRIGQFIVVAAEVGAFEADAATALVKLGADIAFAGNSEHNTIRVSGRASQGIQSACHLDLAGDIFQPLGRFFDGSGGGHCGAAAFNGKGNDAHPVLLKCVELSKKVVSKRFPGARLKEYT
jgi:nanoRNase/pAp phosphatase (c-di-AMP/oligoRNAs hydrolase)